MRYINEILGVISDHWVIVSGKQIMSYIFVSDGQGIMVSVRNRWKS